MPNLTQRLAHIGLCVTIALPLLSTTAFAGGNGSLFTQGAQVNAGLLAASLTTPLHASANARSLLFTQSDPARRTRTSRSADPADTVRVASASARRSPAKVDPADLQCLSEALYHEARGEGVQGQRAVAEVILNRVDSGLFPRTVCGVVNQPSQFSYTIGGAKPIRNKAAFLRARDIAAEALAGAPRTLTGGATYFHTPAVSPAWSHRFQRTVQIGQHIFYRSNQRLASN